MTFSEFLSTVAVSFLVVVCFLIYLATHDKLCVYTPEHVRMCVVLVAH